MESELSKKFYRIRDVAELVDLPQSTLRYWESEFPALRPRRTDGNTRLYTPSDIELIRVIKFLIKDKGLTIEGAREHMKRNPMVVEKRHEVIRRLQDIRKRLSTLLDSLDSRR